MEEAATFTSGLSIQFSTNLLNVQGSFIPGKGLVPGQRGPDVQLQKPGNFETTRLNKVTPNTSRFYVMIFVGEPEHTSRLFLTFSNATKFSKLASNTCLPISWITISGRSGPSAFELLGGAPLGKVYFDQQQTAHSRYGVDVQKGAVVVLRPDGWIGTGSVLGDEAVTELETYFARFLVL